MGACNHLAEGRKDLALELGVRVLNENGEVRNGASINNRLCQLGRVLADVRERRCGNALERNLGLLDAVDEERYSACVDDRSSKLGVVTCNIPVR